MTTRFSIVIPAYHEAEARPPYLAEVRSCLEGTSPYGYEVIAVADGVALIEVTWRLRETIAPGRTSPPDQGWRRGTEPRCAASGTGCPAFPLGGASGPSS